MIAVSPFQIPQNLPTSWRDLQNLLNRYAGRGFALSTKLKDGVYPAVGSDTASVVVPEWCAPEDGWVVRSARLIVGSTKDRNANGPYLVITPRIRNADGAVSLGSYSSRQYRATLGIPFFLTGTAPVDRQIPKDSSLEVSVEQTGWPLVTAEDCTVSWVIARTGA